MTSRDIVLVVALSLANAAIAWTLITLAGSDVAGTELALRMTARVSFVYFMLAFIASPLHQLSGGRVGAALLRHRSAIGATFGFSMAIHVMFILRLFTLHAPERPPMVTERRVGTTTSRRGRGEDDDQSQFARDT